MRPFRFVLAGILPVDFTQSFDQVSGNLKTVKDADRSQDRETGWDRLKLMFQYDELNGVSSELNSIYQAGYIGTFIGALYGGIISSRSAYMDFMENNQATAFKSHLDAKRTLQDRVTMTFAKGAFRWGWRIGLFTLSYAGITTCISVYRNKSSIVEYLAAGSLTGAVYKCNLGLRGIAVGSAVGGVLGGLSGCISLLLLKATGTSMEEVRYWQYKWKQERDITITDSFKSQEEPPSELVQAHDIKVGHTKLNLENVK